MSASPVPVALSQIDEERFGIRTARASAVTHQSLPVVLQFCAANGIELLIARCSTLELDAAQAMEQYGFRLMDTLVYYSRKLDHGSLPNQNETTGIRLMQPGEEQEVQRVASQSFQGYSGHYHADERLDRTKCDEVYRSWAGHAAALHDDAHAVLIAEGVTGLAGFVTVRMNSDVEGEGVLSGIAASAQGKGLYRSLMSQALYWCWAHSAQRMVVSTQLTNVAVQKVWTRLAFEPRDSFYTFHKWFTQ